jgi:hypothetical protein
MLYSVQATIHICIASDHFIHLIHQRLRSNMIIASAVKADVICVTSMPQVIFIQMVRGHRNPITCNEARVFFEARFLVLMFIHNMHGHAKITQYDHEL